MSTPLAIMVDNIIDRYHAASPEHKKAGAGWYSVANVLAEEIGLLAGANEWQAPIVGAGILAAVSPRQSWTHNITAARAIAIRPYIRPPSVFTTSWAKAQRIAYGEAPSTVLGGAKVRAFYRNILGDQTCCTIDGWALKAACGMDASDRELERKGGYARVEGAYIHAANLLDIPAPTLQAICWLSIQQEGRSIYAAHRVARRRENR